MYQNYKLCSNTLPKIWVQSRREKLEISKGMLCMDLDNDNVLGREEFLEYDEGRLTPKLVNRIFQLNIQDSRKMSYWDWVIFLLADIDKSCPSSLEFWFPVLTMSSTTENKLSIHDLHQFYKDNLKILISSKRTHFYLIKYFAFDFSLIFCV